jgi:hypothetical protein
MTKATPENPAIELLLYSGTCRSLGATLRFMHSNGRDKVQLLLGAAAIAQIWIVLMDIVPHPLSTATGLALVAVVVLDLIEWLVWSDRPASPAFIEAAMRHVDPANRLDFLERIDTVSLRGELKPVSMSSVIDTVKALKRQWASIRSDEHLRRSWHARLQAALIDAYRSV